MPRPTGLDHAPCSTVNSFVPGFIYGASQTSVVFNKVGNTVLSDLDI